MFGKINHTGRSVLNQATQWVLWSLMYKGTRDLLSQAGMETHEYNISLFGPLRL